MGVNQNEAAQLTGYWFVPIAMVKMAVFLLK